MENNDNNTNNTPTLPVAWADPETRGDKAYAYIKWRDEKTNEVVRRQSFQSVYIGSTKKWDTEALHQLTNTFNGLVAAGLPRTTATVREVREAVTQTRAGQMSAAQAIGNIAANHRLDINATSVVSAKLAQHITSLNGTIQDGTE